MVSNLVESLGYQGLLMMGRMRRLASRRGRVALWAEDLCFFTRPVGLIECSKRGGA